MRHREKETQLETRREVSSVSIDRYDGATEASALLLQMEVDALTRRNAILMDRIKDMGLSQTMDKAVMGVIPSSELTSSNNQTTHREKHVTIDDNISGNTSNDDDQQESEDDTGSHNSSGSGCTVPYSDLDRRITEVMDSAIIKERVRHSKDLSVQQEKYKNMEKSFSRDAKQMELKLLDLCDSTARHAVILMDATNLVLLQFMTTVMEIRQRVIFQEQTEFIVLVQRNISRIERYKSIVANAREEHKYVRPVIDPVELCLSSWAETGVVNL